MDAAQTLTIIAALSTVTLASVGAQAFWVARALDGLTSAMDRGFAHVDRRFEEVDRRFEEVDRRFEQIEGRLGRIEGRLDRIETNVLRDHGERIARLEGSS